jgi:hypothetical protein
LLRIAEGVGRDDAHWPTAQAQSTAPFDRAIFRDDSSFLNFDVKDKPV